MKAFLCRRAKSAASCLVGSHVGMFRLEEEDAKSY